MNLEQANVKNSNIPRTTNGLPTKKYKQKNKPPELFNSHGFVLKLFEKLCCVDVENQKGYTYVIQG